MPKVKRKKVGAIEVRHNPLAAQIHEEESGEVKPREKAREKSMRKRQWEEDYEEADAEEGVNVVSGNLGDRILKSARLQRAEEERLRAAKGVPAEGDDSDGSDDDIAYENFDEEIEEELVIDESDERAMKMFMPQEPGERRCLADIVMAKLREHEEVLDQRSVHMETHKPQGKKEKPQGLSSQHPKVIATYRAVGDIMRRYRSGKVPKAFKIIPALSNWEDILCLTSPQSWSGPSWYQATRLFASNLNDRMAQRFYNVYLLPVVRDALANHKKLGHHLYRALMKSVFKPGAFYRGLAIPLCDDGTLKEATVLASIITKASIPVLESSAALLRLAEMPYNGVASIFIRALLNKKYALPYSVIDKVVEHFCAMEFDERELPLLWHQSLQSFVERYKMELLPEQKEQLKRLMRARFHPKVTNEIRKDLFSTTITRGMAKDDMEGAEDIMRI